MSRVRIYELAKEAGMSSKALAAKLIEDGYEVKGHSSTVDEETAKKIRSTMFKSGDTELVEKRISGSAGPTVIRRRTTVIRRKPKAAPVEEEAAPQKSEAELEAQAPVDIQEPVAVDTESSEQEAQAKAAAETPEDVAEVEAASETDTSPAKTAGETEADVEAASEPTAAADAGTTEEAPAADEKDTGEEPPKVTDAVSPVKKVAPARKGYARVVGTIEIPQEEEKPSPKPRKKTARSGVVKKGRPQGPATPGVAPPDVAAGSGKSRKKGKRAAGDAGDSQDRGRKQDGKAGKKGRRNVKFTHFGGERHQPGRRGKKGKGRGESRPVQPAAEMKAIKKRIKIFETITVGDLASRMRVKGSEVITKLMGLGVMATLNQAVDVETAMLIASDFGYEVEQGITEEIGIQMLNEQEEGGETKPRSPVVTVMGHVDHGKTSILDAIRKTDVAEGEAGGITQHIGAYHVKSKAGDVTFVDTPGHAAFTEMRSRGAQVTDVVILVVAADDGVMDQTREAIRHAQAAEVPIIVAVNKIDKDNADPERVKRELSDYDLVPEEWGGDTIFCETSAKQGLGIDGLMENIQLMAEMLELGADADRKARGRVIEAKLDKGRGPVATVLVQQGTLHTGEHFVVGKYAGKVRAMLDYKGKGIKEAGPSIPVEVQGLSGVPQAGDEFVVVTDEKMAKSVSHARSMKVRESELGANTKISLDKLFEKMSEGDVKELRVVLRADVQGTLEAFAKAAEKLSTDAIKVRVLHEGTGTITESDILLASASEAIIIGFNVRPTAKVKELAGKENVDVRSYDVIYHALDDIRKAMVGLLDPTFEEDVIGSAEVREIFHAPKVGTIAGCSVSDGKIQRNAGVRVLRDGVVMYTGKIGSLRRFKDDVKEVLTGYECGIGVENFNDIKVGDNLEAFIMLEVEATLGPESGK